LQALYTTHGQSKAELMTERLLQINPSIKINTHKEFKEPSKVIELLKNNYTYVVDAIDSVTPKVYLIQTAYKMGHKIVSSMGAGGKMDPTQVIVGDLFETDICPLAYYVRKRVKKMGVRKGVKAVFSTELPLKDSLMLTDGSNFKKSAYGTISYLPAVFGLTCASVVIRDIVAWKEVK
jgi:tRNA A37 threonylcarbamoyladenosine dehydratase